MEALNKYAEIIQEHSYPAIEASFQHDPELARRIVAVPLDESAFIGANGIRAAVVESLPLVTIISSVGKNILIKAGIRFDSDNEEARVRAKVGWHFLYPLVELEYIKFELEKDETGKEKDTREKYRVKIINSKLNTGGFIDQLTWAVRVNEKRIKLQSEPQFTKPTPYEGFYNPDCGALIPKAHKKAIPYFTVENCPKVFEAVNTHQEIPFALYQDALDVYDSCNSDPLWNFSEETLTKGQREGKIRERDEIMMTARYIADRRFYEFIYLDFRGRFYPFTNYLNHIGSKMAKALMFHANKKPLGKNGLKWVKFSVANHYGKDKLPIDDRVKWVEDNEDMIMFVGRHPSTPEAKTIWQNEDIASPYEFMVACMEYSKIIDSGDPENYVSGLPISIDATCSGLQVLATLLKCLDSGKLCNLTATDQISDYYNYIAEYVWEHYVETMLDKFDNDLHYTEEDMIIFRKTNNDLRRFSVRMRKATKKDQKKAIKAERKVYTKENEANIEIACRVFWARPEIKAKRRKIMKRGCMTYFYSCGDITMAEQLKKDFGHKKLFTGMNFYHCAWLTDKLYDSCQKLMPGPTRLMELFVDLAVREKDQGIDFSMVAPYSKFLMMQNYKVDKTTPVEFKYKKRKKLIKLRLTTNKSEEIDPNKTQSAPAPNIVHMLDAQLVVAILLLAKSKGYEVSCTHDCFATVPGDAEELYTDIRKVFIETLEGALENMLEQKGTSLEQEGIQLGDLDPQDIMRNQYAFA